MKCYLIIAASCMLLAAAVPTPSRFQKALKQKFCHACFVRARWLPNCQCCQSDDDCESGRCLGYCQPCTVESRVCGSDSECCDDMICRKHRCQTKIKLGTLGARCQRQSDCNEGLCCANDHHSEGYICKDLSKAWEACSQSGSIEEYNCPCEEGLTCYGSISNFWLSYFIKYRGKSKSQVCVPKNRSSAKTGLANQESGSTAGDFLNQESGSANQESRLASGDFESGSADQESASASGEFTDDESGSADQESGSASGDFPDGESGSASGDFSDYEVKSTALTTLPNPCSQPVPEISTTLSPKQKKELERQKKIQEKECKAYTRIQEEIERIKRLEKKDDREREKLQRAQLKSD